MENNAGTSLSVFWFGWSHILQTTSSENVLCTSHPPRILDIHRSLTPSLITRVHRSDPLDHNHICLLPNWSMSHPLWHNKCWERNIASSVVWMDFVLSVPWRCMWDVVWRTKRASPRVLLFFLDTLHPTCEVISCVAHAWSCTLVWLTSCRQLFQRHCVWADKRMRTSFTCLCYPLSRRLQSKD